MCNVCCQEFRGWCKAFTRTERLLTILEGVLLVLFIAFLSFVVLHLLACPTHELDNIYEVASETQIFLDEVTPTPRGTLGPDIKCTWKASQKTKAITRYYEYGQPPLSTTTKMESEPVHETDTHMNWVAAAADEEINDEMVGEEDWRGWIEESDGEDPESGFEKFVLALVKIKPMGDITFGCILTVVSEYWALTAASCVEAVEEVESLDAFVMLAGSGAAHGVADARVHPGRARGLDAAALRSAGRLAVAAAAAPRASMLDYLLLTVGERLTILGYGKFRTVEARTSNLTLRQVAVHRLPSGACADAAGGGEAEGALRHLSRGEALRPGACAPAPLCAGPLRAGAAPCGYCAGTPLLVRGALLGLMAGGGACGEACEPQLYVNVPGIRDWIDAVIDEQI